MLFRKSILADIGCSHPPAAIDPARPQRATLRPTTPYPAKLFLDIGATQSILVHSY